MNANIQIPELTSGCDLCGSTQAQMIFTTPRLDGPLMRCESCGLFYVLAEETSSPSPAVTEPAIPIEPAVPIIAAIPSLTESEQVAAEMTRLASRARELALVEPDVEEREQHWRGLTSAERLKDLQRVTASKGGRLLEIGCSTGEFLATAQASFKVTGVEADRASCAVTQAHGFSCFNGTLFEARFPASYFDLVVMYHVIEHFPSPQQILREIHRILWPKGWIVIETPNIDNLWYKLLGARWRQFIPDHRFFFTPATIKRLCQQNGFEVVAIQSVRKAMSVRLFISRIGRYHKPTSRWLARWSERFHWGDRTLHLNLGDVMRVYARRK